MAQIPMMTTAVSVHLQANGWTVNITQRPDPEAWVAHQKATADAKEKVVKAGAEVFLGGLMKNMADPAYQDIPQIEWPTIPSMAPVDINADQRPTTHQVYVFEGKDDLINFLAENL